MNLLIAIANPERARLQALLAEQAGVQAVVAGGGLYALTQLERGRPDAIICDDDLGDLRGEELFDIVRSDPATAWVPFYLLADEAPQNFIGPLNRLLSPRFTSQQVLEAVLRQAAPGRQPLDGTRDVQLRGTLEIISLFDLVVSLNQMRKGGQLLVGIGYDQAQFMLREGEVVMTEFRGVSGEQAFSDAFVATETAPTAGFSFHALSPQTLTQLPGSISKPTSRLLMEVAVHLDHMRAQRPRV